MPQQLKLFSHLMLTKTELEHFIALLDLLISTYNNQFPYLLQLQKQFIAYTADLTHLENQYKKLQNSLYFFQYHLADHFRLIDESTVLLRESMNQDFLALLKDQQGILLTAAKIKQKKMDGVLSEAVEYKDYLRQLEVKHQLETFAGDFIKEHKNFIRSKGKIIQFMKNTNYIKKISTDFLEMQDKVSDKLCGLVNDIKVNQDKKLLQDAILNYKHHLTEQRLRINELYKMFSPNNDILSACEQVHQSKIKLEKMLIPRFLPSIKPVSNKQLQRKADLSATELTRIREKRTRYFK